MKVRMIKRRHDARTLHRWRFLADLRAEMLIEDWPWDDDDMPDDVRLHCHPAETVRPCGVLDRSKTPNRRR